MEYRTIVVEREDGIALVTLNRPAALNAVDEIMLAEIGEAFGALEQDPSLRIVILTGAGERAFVAGADVASMSKMSMLDARKFVCGGQQLLLRIERSSLVTIAAVNGHALGGGTELVLACDIRIAAETARFGLPETSLGLLPGWGGTQRLARLVGPNLAKELIFTARRVAADEALRLGLVNRVVPASDLMTAARDVARQVLHNSPIAVRQAKRAIDQGTQMSIDQGLAIEAEAWMVLFATHDRLEGTTAFVEKRAPRFTGE